MTRKKWDRSAHEDHGARRASWRRRRARYDEGRRERKGTSMQNSPDTAWGDDRAVLRIGAVPASARTGPPQRPADLVWAQYAIARVILLRRARTKPNATSTSSARICDWRQESG